VATTQWIANQKLPANVYLDSVNGNDANDGLTSGTALKTIAGLRSLISKKLEAYKGTVTVHLASGSYDSLVGVRNVQVLYISNGSVTTTGASASQPDQYITLSGSFTLTGNINAIRGGRMSIANGSSLSFSGLNTTCAIAAYGGGIIFTYLNNTVSFSFTSCTFSRGTVDLQGCGLLYLQGTENWSGSPTGKRYNLVGCSCLYGGGSPTAIPGTVAGTADSTSSFIN
jgi:hypothetical protein